MTRPFRLSRARVALAGREVRCLAIALALAGVSRTAAAQTDEIQVYDASLTPRGKINLTLHNNFTPDGLKTPAFPGALVSNRSLNGVPEWAYGIADWLEGGLYLPLYSIGTVGTSRSPTIDGAKLRLLVAVPHAKDRRFFYGANFEFSYNSRHWAPTRFASELRPIVGWHLHRVDIIVNPILDTSYTGAKNIDFAPAARLACNVSDVWAIAVEEYAEVGPLRGLLPIGRQTHQLWGVFDRSSRALDIEVGVGFGLTGASDGLTLKLMLSRDLD